MNRPLFSVIIPCFNAEETVEQALLSVTGQTFRDFEIIVVDGLSTDNTPNILKKYETQFTALVSEKDHGVYDAMNKGIALSKGKLIYLLGADDRFHSPDVLKETASFMQPEDELLYGNVTNNDVRHPLVPKLHRSKWSRALYLRNTLHQQGCFYRRELLEENPFDAQYRILADYDLHLKLYDRNIRARHLPFIIADCRAQGLSKRFIYALYTEEMDIKRNRFNRFGYVLSYAWVHIKYLVKKWSSADQ